MAGILDSKTRIFDTILTTEGRKQIAQGRLIAEFYSFTDAGTFYNQDTIVSGGFDETYRIQLEATNLPQDTITLEADDSGRLTGFPISGSTRFVIRGGQILSSSSENETVPVTGSQYASLSETLLESSIDNFKKLYILRSPDPIDLRERQFIVGPKEATFAITENKPFSTASISSVNINNVEGFFQDKRLSHIPNYEFLPPVNKPRLGVTEATPLGEFVNLNQEPVLTFEDVEKEVTQFEEMGFAQEFLFTETSRQSNIVGQFFESAQNELQKLDVIDFGSFTTTEGVTKHVFFVGKIYNDDLGVDTFIQLFTLIFE